MIRLGFINGWKVKETSKTPCDRKVEEDAFKEFSKVGLKQGFEVFFTYIRFLDGNKVKYGWILKNNKWIKVKDKEIDYIYRYFDPLWDKIFKKLTKGFNIPSINKKELDYFCWDKFKTAKKFKKFCPKTYLVKDIHDLKKAFSKIKGKVVLKPRFGVQGIGAVVLNKFKKIKIKEEMVAQEFIDTSNGIPELKIKGVHDLRVILLNGKIEHSYVRLAEKGDFRSNCAKGGHKIFVKKIPKAVIPIINKVNKKFKKFIPRLHTVDVIFDENGKVYLMELESQLGTYYYKGKEKLRRDYYSNVFKAIQKDV